MRQGPDYNMWVDRDKSNWPYIKVPLELVHEWEGLHSVVWHDNGDGTYTITLK